MNELARARLVGIEVVFRDLETTLMVALPKCDVKELACPCRSCRINGAYSLFLKRLNGLTAENVK